jgi:hypothetical protein
MRKNLENRECRKRYLARVQGSFPSKSASSGPSDDDSATLPPGCSWVEVEENATEGGLGGQWIRVDVPLSWNPKTNHVTAMLQAPSDGQDSAQSSKKNKDEDAKEAVTLFRCVSRSEKAGFSIVECSPLTGRTHQIRVHLQYLGYSIANDTQYGGLSGPPLVYRLNRERTGPSTSDEQEGTQSSSKRLKSNLESDDQRIQDDSGSRSKGLSSAEESLVTLEGQEDALPDDVRELYESSLYRVEPSAEEKICPHCPCLVPRGYPIDLEPLYLYAYAYRGPGWGFRVPPPEWVIT